MRVEKLDVDQCSLSSEFFVSISRCSALRHLSLSGVAPGDVSVFVSLASLVHLEYLCIRECKLGTAEFARILQLPRLKTLLARGCEHVQGSAVLSAPFERLEQFELPLVSMTSLLENVDTGNCWVW